MKTNALINQIIETASVKKDLAAEAMVQTLQYTIRTPRSENSLITTKTTTKIQPIDDFRYSQRCYCGVN